MRYSFLTLVTDPAQHAAMRASAVAAGFGEDDCEYLVIDNSAGNVADAYDGLTRLMVRARGAMLVLLHQDVSFDFDDRAALEARLAELDALDPTWAVCGVAGCRGAQDVVRITDKFGRDRRVGGPPAQVDALDECLMITPAAARLRFSRDVGGFHFYGADLCEVASMLGHSAWVIDFHVAHHGDGATGASFAEAQARFTAKWRRARRSRYLRTTCGAAMLTGDLPAPLAKALEALARARVSRQRRRARARRGR